MATPKTIKVKIEEVKLNSSNPRIIKDAKFKKLVKSIQDFPEMLQLRPIVVDENNEILGGNMRYRAVVEAGLKEVYIIKADTLTEEQKKEFIIKDNVGYGEWDWDILANEWNNDQLEEWGLDVWKDNTNYLEEAESTTSSNSEVKNGAQSDDYSVFELVMLYENKLILLDTINQVKNNFLFEKQEEALMEIIRVYNNTKK